MIRSRFAPAALVLAMTLTVAVLPAASARAADTSAPAAAKKSPKKEIQDKAMQQIDQQIASAKVDKAKADWRTTLTAPTVATFDPAHKYYCRMVTNKGTIRIRFMPDVAPMHVTSFSYLARMGFYDGLSFHRVIKGFMAQGGCPLGNGMGGPGYKFAGEFNPGVKHDRPGLLSMANAGPGTDGSQFFLTFVPTPWLDGKHTLFGEVVEGMDVLKTLESAGSSSGATSESLKMDKVTIEVE
jgi:peptidyl-prolyl cis-trans isomerase B (cyclophilin B)